MRKVVAFVGRIGAGKDEAANYLSERLGWPVFKISQPLKDELKKLGKEIDRENLAHLGNDWSKRYGDHYLAQLALEQNSENFIASGPRQLGQMEYFRKNCDFYLVEVQTDDEKRFQRAQNRSEELKEAHNLEMFLKDEIEKDASDGAQQVLKCIEMADHHISNNGTIEDLHREIDSLIDILKLK